MRPSLALDAHRPALRSLMARYDVSHPRVFGSVLHQTDTDDSDLDLLVQPSDTTTLFTLARLQNEAETLLGLRVSILTPGSLPKAFRARVLAEAQAL